MLSSSQCHLEVSVLVSFLHDDDWPQRIVSFHQMSLNKPPNSALQ